MDARKGSFDSMSGAKKIAKAAICRRFITRAFSLHYQLEFGISITRISTSMAPGFPTRYSLNSILLFHPHIRINPIRSIYLQQFLTANMKTEVGVVGRVRKFIRKKKLDHKKRNQMRRPTVLQRLFISCQKLFKGLGTTPSSDDVQNLCRILDVMTPEDVGLSRDLQFFNTDRGIPRVTYTNIYKCKKFWLTLFIFPAGAVIPLHNHPEMTVFNKLLLGTMHIKSYDWVDTNNMDDLKPLSQLRLAGLKADSVFTAPCDTSVLYPTSGGNIHAFTALTPCLVLDVLGPPYSKDDGRDCSFYVDFPCKDIPSNSLLNATKTMKEEEGERKYGWLQEIEPPKDAEMDGVEYHGPPVFDFTAKLDMDGYKR